MPVPSAHIPVDPSCRYERVPHLAGLTGERASFVGGINKPKLVEAADSAGGRHRQLVKAGNDDLRQDAVMQQLFWLLNRFLEGRCGAGSSAGTDCGRRPYSGSSD